MNAKILIVDDEPTICSGLRFTIPWEEIGAEIVGEAYNGLQALPWIESGRVDLILTDVLMPGMSGLELLEKIAERNLSVKIVMISGYDEFQYVRRALKHGVRDYLLKPVDIDELTRLVHKLTSEIREEKEQALKRDWEKMCAYLFSNQARGMDENLHRFRVMLDRERRIENARLMVSEIRDYGTLIRERTPLDPSHLQEEWKKVVSRVLPKGTTVLSFFVHPNMLLTLFCHRDGTPISDAVFGDRCGELTAGDNLPIEWAVSDTLPTLHSFRETFDRTVELLKRRSAAGCACRHKEHHPQRGAENKRYPKEMEKKLLQHFFERQDAEMQQTVAALFGRFAGSGYLVGEAYQVCQEMKMLIYRRLREHMGPDLLDEKDSYFSAVDLQIYNSLPSLQRLFIEELRALSDVFKSLNVGKNRWIVDRVVRHIHKHYSEDLKASELAEMIKVTPNYFSLIFKQETGKSYNEYLNQLRIEKAKEMLLATNDLVYEIAEQVGYKEYKYFSMVFKKITGVVPSDFRGVKQERKPS